jgi:hypothetical protein
MVARPLLIPRYVLPAIVPLVILGAAFLAAFPRPVMVLAVALLLYLQAPYTLHRRPLREGIREITQRLNAQPDTHRPLLLADWAYTDRFISPEETGLRYYGLRERPVLWVRTQWPRDTLLNPEVLQRPDAYDVVCFRGADKIDALLHQWRRPFEAKQYHLFYLLQIGPARPADRASSGP